MPTLPDHEPSPARFQPPSWSYDRLLVDRIEDYAIFMLDPLGVVVSWNRGAEKIKGYTAAEIVGQHFSVFYPAEDLARDKPAQELRTARAQGHVEDEGWRLRKDGSRFWASVSITALRDDDGELRGFAKVTRDLTERSRREEELQRSEESFRLLVEGVVDYAIYLLGPDGTVTTWNSGAKKIKGYESWEIIGEHFSRFFSEDDRAADRPRFELELAETQGRFAEEGWRIRKDGSRFWASVVVTALRSASGQLLGFAKVTRDLTERRAAEETTRELVRQQTARVVSEQSEARIAQERERYRKLSQRLEVILEGVLDGITVQDRTGRVLFANSAAARMSGLPSVEALVTADLRELMERFELFDEHGEPFPLELLPGRRVLAGEKAAAALVCVRDRHSGHEGWSSVRASAVPGADGTPELAINILHDVTADRRREQHRRRLHEVTTALSSSLDYQSTLEKVVGLLIPELADWCMIHLLRGDELRTVAVAHRNASDRALAREYDPTYPPNSESEHRLWSVVRSAESQLINDMADERPAADAGDDGQVRALRASRMKSLLAVPIRVRDRVLGTLSLLTSESKRRFDEEDLALVEELGRRVGAFIDNASLYAAEKRAREQLELLAHAGEAFSGSLDYDETLRSLLQIALPTLGDFVLLEIEDHGGFRRLAAHADSSVDALLEAHSKRPLDPERRLLGTPDAPGFHPYIDAELQALSEADRAGLELFVNLQPTSLVTAPLKLRGRRLATLVAGFTRSDRRHTQEDQRLIEELLRRASMALVQALLYEEAQAAAHRAEEAGRIKDEFLATVSHELRTPLNAIVGWSFLLRTRNTDPALSKGLDAIHRNAQAQSKIIEDILDVARIVTGKLRLELKSADLTQIIQDAIDVVRPSASAKGIDVEFKRPSEPCVLLADPERLQQVLWNLLSNAVKFSEGGRSVSVELERASAHLVVTVKDAGKGIDLEFLPYVFDRFKQADGSTTRRYGGLGLGLAIVRHIVELHGGRVSAFSAGIGAGAEFSITLPLRTSAPSLDIRPSKEPAPDSHAPRPLARALSGLRVLVVDDEADARDLLSTVFSAAGASVEAAASSAEAFERIQAFQPHVLVSDVGMPGEDGYALIRRVRALDLALGGEIPALALTAYTRAEDKAHALAAGFNAHMGKPFHPEALLAAVENLTRGRIVAAAPSDS